MFVIDKTGKMVMAVSEEYAGASTFTIGKKGEVVRDSGDGNLEGRRHSEPWIRVGGSRMSFGSPVRPAAIAKPEAKAELSGSLPKGPLVIKGNVVDLEGRPLRDADVEYELVGNKKTKTGSTGHFSFTLEPTTECTSSPSTGRAGVKTILVPFPRGRGKAAEGVDGTLDRAEWARPSSPANGSAVPRSLDASCERVSQSPASRSGSKYADSCCFTPIRNRSARLTSGVLFAFFMSCLKQTSGSPPRLGVRRTKRSHPSAASHARDGSTLDLGEFHVREAARSPVAWSAPTGKHHRRYSPLRILSARGRNA